MTDKRVISLPGEDAAWLDAKVTAGGLPSFLAGVAELIPTARRWEAWLAAEADAFGEPLPDDPEREAYWTARLHRSTADDGAGLSPGWPST
ncbi:hypothetical protein [Nonomuraea guangzhouensis]|uniref:Uncharacterized protein n=1 Tax=Nonomuraea guangzhouensis TaxID=1291555 RepID=A0ABW4G657_9ACTN|nr:hypothetical protein [Nonomuraea guangzhouensis]